MLLYLNLSIVLSSRAGNIPPFLDQRVEGIKRLIESDIGEELFGGVLAEVIAAVKEEVFHSRLILLGRIVRLTLLNLLIILGFARIGFIKDKAELFR